MLAPRRRRERTSDAAISETQKNREINLSWILKETNLIYIHSLII